MRWIFLTLFIVSCSSGTLKYQGEKNIFKNNDFEQIVKIKTDEENRNLPTQSLEPQNVVPSVNTTENTTTINTAITTEISDKVEQSSIEQSTSPILYKENSKGMAKSKKIGAKKNETNQKRKDNEVLSVSTTANLIPSVRQPEIEDNVGFEGSNRRPKVDPFQVGEVVTHSVRYFAAEAGVISFNVKPMIKVNGRKSYQFVIDLKSSGIFSKFYSVDDQVETYLDFEDLVPHVFKLHLKESAQLKEAQSYFDHKTLKATYWENKYTEKNGHQEKKLEWEILPYSQNAFSGIFYMRLFKWEIDKEYSFRVSDDKKNIIFKGVALQKEKLKTEAGLFSAIKIKVQIVSRGMLEQTGDMYIWLSDDDRRYVLRIEAKIKIGTLVSEITKLTAGKSN